MANQVINNEKSQPGLAERFRQRTHNSCKAGSTPAPWINKAITIES